MEFAWILVFVNPDAYSGTRVVNKNRKTSKFGGLKWTRTIDLTLIRRAL